MRCRLLVAALCLLPALAAAQTSRTVMMGTRGNMEASLYAPDGPGPFPGVIVMHTSGGLIEADRAYCARLAREGFICAAPAFLRANGIRLETRDRAFTTER